MFLVSQQDFALVFLVSQQDFALVFLISQLDSTSKLYSLLQPYRFSKHPFLEQKHAEPKKESLQLYPQMK